MTDLLKVTDARVIIGTAAEVAKLNVGGGVFLYSAVDDFVALIMRPSDGDNATRIQVQGDNGIAHSQITFYQIAPTGAGSPTDSRMEFQVMDAGTLATRLTIDESGNVLGSTGKALLFALLKALDANGLTITDDGGNVAIFVEDGGQVGIANTNPVAAIDVSGRVKIRGAASNTTWTGDGQLALKTTGGDGFLGVTFHEEDGDRLAVISASESVMAIEAVAQINILTDDTERIVIKSDGKVGIGGYDTLGPRPVLGQLHVIGDTNRTGFICVESPATAFGATPVVLIDQEGSSTGVNYIATGNVLITSSDSTIAHGAFISVKNNTTQVITLDGSNSITFEVVNNSAQLTVYRSAGTKAYFVSFMGMYT